MEESHMCDICRILKPELPRYTWRRFTNKGISQSRLDYFITANSFVYNIEKADIKPSFLSDHNIITLQFLGNTDQSKGKGMWKFNTSLLKDNEYVVKMNKLFEEQCLKYADMYDKGLAWDAIECQIRGFTVIIHHIRPNINVRWKGT